MSRIKGAAIRARLEYLREKHGDDALQRVIETLDEMDQVILGGTVLPSIWYPFQVLANFDEAACRLLGDGDHSLFEAAGEHVGEQHARSIYRVFFKETEPSRVLRLASCIYANYYSGLGRLSLRSDDDGRHERLVIQGAPGTARPNCVTAMAYFKSVLASCTGMTVEARETRCTCWGDEACEFEFGCEQVLERAVG